MSPWKSYERQGPFIWTAFYKCTWIYRWFPNLKIVAGWYSCLEKYNQDFSKKCYVLHLNSTLINDSRILQFLAPIFLCAYVRKFSNNLLAGHEFVLVTYFMGNICVAPWQGSPQKIMLRLGSGLKQGYVSSALGYVEQLVEALCYKLVGRGFDSQNLPAALWPLGGLSL